ncbi:MAG: DUF3419 family protein [Candidatus Eiseniibacteriota bacterium]
MITGETAWARGRLDARHGPSRLLFGRMHEDASIELGAFQPSGRVFCIASAGCTAMHLAPRHEVVAVDINSAQLAYAARRFAGGDPARGSADRLLAVGRALVSLAGWRASKLRTFLDLEDTSEQLVYWSRHLDTRRFRTTLEVLLSAGSLRAVYAPRFLDLLPHHLAAAMRGRMERCFARHPNRTNPYARALLMGEWPHETTPPEARTIRLVHSDGAAYLEQVPPGSFDGFALSNILDGANQAYAERLFRAVKRAARPGAVVVRRSFAEVPGATGANRAAEDRAMLWGLVDVRAAASLEGTWGTPARRPRTPRAVLATPRLGSQVGAGSCASVVTRATFDAPPDRTWAGLMFYEQIVGRPPLLLRLLLPTPVHSEGLRAEVGAEATCVYLGGHLLKRVSQIVKGRRLEFDVVEQNLSVGGGVRLVGGGYTLAALRGERTEVALDTRYMSSRRPRWLWAPIEAALCHLFHRHVLNTMRRTMGRA